MVLRMQSSTTRNPAPTDNLESSTMIDDRNSSVSIRDHYLQATKTLRRYGSPTPTIDSLCLLQHVLAVDKSELFCRLFDELTVQQCGAFYDLLDKRCQQQPIAYLVGEQEFYGYKFYVDQRVLIPRPTSEQLIDVALGVGLPAKSRVLDIGCGSGCLAITLALTLPNNIQVEAWDINDDILSVARRNALRHNCLQIDFRVHDIFSNPVKDGRKFDLLVSNPPYIHRHEQLPVSVSNFEPFHALDNRGNNLPFYRQLATIGSQILLATGSIVIEINPVDMSKVIAIFVSQGYHLVGQYQDLQGLPRTLLFTRGLNHG